MILTYWEIQKTIDLLDDEYDKLKALEPIVDNPEITAVGKLHEYNAGATLEDLSKAEEIVELSPEMQRVIEYRSKLKALVNELTFDLTRIEGKVSSIS